MPPIITVDADVPSAIPLVADGRLIVDTPCLTCGYNLRTLAADAICPECGQPVQLSIRGDQLRFAAPRWVAGLARGAKFILIAMGLAVAAMFAMPLVMMFVVPHLFAPGGPSGGVLEILLAVLPIVIGLAVLIVWIAGALLLTARDPAARDAPQGRTARRVTRMALLVACVATVGYVIDILLIDRLGVRPFGSSVPGWMLGVVVVAMFISAYVVLPLAFIRHLANLMRRVPRPGLVRFARILFWAYAAAALLLIAGYAIMFVSMFKFMRTTAATMPTATMPTTTLPATASARLAAIGYTSASSVTVTIGGVTTTTMPAATMPAGAVVGPPPPAFMFAMLVGPMSGCGILGVMVAWIVLMVLAQRALADAAREAEANSRYAAAVVPPAVEPK